MRTEFALAVGSVLVALLLAEVSIRLVDRIRCFDDTSGIFVEPHPLYGWRHTPGTAAWAKRCRGTVPEWATYVRINSHGLRDREIPYERDDAYRILVLGDSFAQALQVELDQTFVKQVERRLIAAAPAGRRVEVINTGVGGYGTTNELLYYRYEARKYRPDLVLLAFDTENDAMENSMPLVREVPAYYPDKPFFVFNGGRLVLQNFPMTQRAQPWRTVGELDRSLARHSMFYRFVHSLSLPRLPTPAHAAGDAAPPLGTIGTLLKDYPPEWQEAWRITRALLRRLRRDVERDGSRFGVVVISGAAEVSERQLARRLYFARQGRARDRFDMDKSYRMITRFLRREHIPFVPLLEAFRAHLRDTGVDGYFQWDPHWTVVGHTLAADVIVRGLEDLQLVPRAATPADGHDLSGTDARHHGDAPVAAGRAAREGTSPSARSVRAMPAA